MDESCFATSNGSRMASFTTFVTNPIREVTAAIAEIATNGSRNGVSGAQKREPSAE